MFTAVKNIVQLALEKKSDQHSCCGCRKGHLDGKVRRRRKDRYLKVSLLKLEQTRHHENHTCCRCVEKQKNLTKDQERKAQATLELLATLTQNRDHSLNDCAETLTTSALIYKCTEKQENTGRKPCENEKQLTQQENHKIPVNRRQMGSRSDPQSQSECRR